MRRSDNVHETAETIEATNTGAAFRQAGWKPALLSQNLRLFPWSASKIDSGIALVVLVLNLGSVFEDEDDEEHEN